ncbi:MAG: uracil-DNA glycosylase [Treponemataceae bacterium]|nr:uracil-DNA glycosylase [Treponemataceae bacterium]
MTKTEKESIYNLLNCASNYLQGFSDNNSKPIEFFDDDDSSIQENAHIEKSTMTLSVLKSKVDTCTRCQLCKTRRNTVFGEGVENPTVLVVGEGPGANEDERGLPFVGEAGHLLDKMLSAINLSRTTNCFIANVVKCRPPQNRDPLPEESAACISYLEAQIHLLKPKMILCVGRVAAHNLFKCADPVNSMRGKLYEVQGIPAMMTYHPSALLRDSSLKRPAWEDLKLFKKELDSICQAEL